MKAAAAAVNSGKPIAPGSHTPGGQAQERGEGMPVARLSRALALAGCVLVVFALAGCGTSYGGGGSGGTGNGGNGDGGQTTTTKKGKGY
jgi:hypothetical protein